MFGRGLLKKGRGDVGGAGTSFLNIYIRLSLLLHFSLFFFFLFFSFLLFKLLSKLICVCIVVADRVHGLRGREFTPTQTFH